MRTCWARRSARANSRSRSASSTRGTSSPRTGSSRTSSSRRSATSSAERPSKPAPGEVESAEEDEDAAEVRREAQQGEQDEDDEDRRVVEVGRDVILVDPRDAAGRRGALGCVVGDLPAEEARRGEDGEDDRVPVADLSQAPPRWFFLRHRSSRRAAGYLWPSVWISGPLAHAST